MRNNRLALVGAALVAALAVALSGPVGEASAAKLVGKNGRIYACYKVRGGKAKGSVRLVARRMHCRRSERKISWSVRGPRGPAGTGGQAGSAGTADTAALESRLSELESRLSGLEGRVESLEGILEGVTNTQLQEAIAAVASVEALCTQMTSMTGLLMPTIPSLPAFSCS